MAVASEFCVIPVKETKIGLIPERYPLATGATKGVQLPKESPLVKGGFGRKPGGEKIFLGKKQYLATSQRGFFTKGKEIPIEKEFFVSPQEPFLKIPETRVSRLGIQDPLASPERATFGLGLPPKPQIGFMRGDIGRVETAKQFVLGKGTELEAIKTFGTIKNVKLVGTTVIKGQGVDIFKFTIGKGTGKAIPIPRTPTTAGAEFVSGYGPVGALTFRTPTRTVPTSVPISPPISPRISPPVSPPISPPISRPTPLRISPPLTRRARSSGRPSPRISPPISPPVSPPISLPISPIISPRISPRVSPPVSPPLVFKVSPPTGRKSILDLGAKQPKRFGKFPVLLRRFGQFKIIGFGRTPKEALSIGRESAARTLGATFKVPGIKPQKIFGFKTKKSKKEGLVFIELPKYRLSKPTERKEIQYFKYLKGGGRL